LPRFEVARLLEIPTGTGSPWLPKGLVGIAWAAPFAIWFYLAVEQVPMAAEESRHPERDIPAAMLLALATLATAAMLTLFLNAGVAPGAEQVGLSPDPLLLGLNAVMPFAAPGLLVLLTLVGSMSSFHSIMYAAGRSVFCLARAGYFPTALSVTSRTRHTPVAAVAASAAASFVLASVVQYAPGDVPLGAVLINMAVFGALLSYSLQFLAYLKLRVRHPGLVRPYRSPLGPTGAVTGLLIAVSTGVLLFSNREYRLGLALCVLIYVIAAVEFAIAGRHRLRPAPEETFAEGLGVAARREQVA
jgi:ethanolamine permease